MRRIPLKLQVAEYAAGWWILRPQPIGADELIQIVQSRRDVIPDFYDRSLLTSQLFLGSEVEMQRLAQLT